MFVLPNLGGGGVEKIWLSLAKKFLSDGLKVGFCLLQQEGELLAQLPAGVTIDVVGVSRFRQMIAPLSKVIGKRSPKAIMVGVWPLPISVFLACKIAGSNAKIIASEHNDYRTGPVSRSPKLRLAMRVTMATIYRRLHAVVAVSDGVADTVSKISGINRGRVRVIYNPIEAPTLGVVPEQGIADEWLGHASGSRLIAIGSMKEQKGFADLLKAFDLVRQTADARLLILGEGRLRGALTALAADLGISDRVSMPGFVQNPAPFLEAADVFVLSSLWEGFGNVLVEAMATGTKVVSTDCPSGPSEILAGTKGRLVPVGSPDRLAQSILTALGEDQNPGALKKKAETFSVDVAAEKYRSLMLV